MQQTIRSGILGISLVISFIQASIAQSFTSSTLPIVIINTNGQEIKDDPKIVADMGIIANGTGTGNKITDPWNQYNGKIAIEVRGSSSQMYPKKSYGFETRESANTSTDRKVSLLGMPEESDWVLYAPYSDKTLMRDVIAYRLAQKMGWYASRYRYCEVVINGDYKGVYILLEKVKRDANRVNVSKLKSTDNTGDDVTGGYILKIDKTTGTWTGGFDSNYPPYLPNGQNRGQKTSFLYVYPELHTPARDDDMTAAQEQYIRTFMNTFETNLRSNDFADVSKGYRKYINPASFVDYFILTESVFNVDGYRLSTYMYKDKDSKGGRLTIGPAWDYNISQGNADYYDGNRTDRWMYQMNYSFPSDSKLVPFWWERLLDDQVYKNDAKCRWLTLRKDVLHTDSVMHFIDSVATALSEPQARNYQRWPILSQYVWPNAKVTGSYKGEVDYLKEWWTARLAWLDSNMPGVCDVLASEDPSQRTKATFYPSPFTNTLQLRLEDQPASTPVTAETYDLLGRKLITHTFIWRNIPEDLPVQALQPGVYMIRLTANGKLLGTHKVIRR